MSVIAFPRAYDEGRGTVHVMGTAGKGFQVSHESASGGSWGALFGPFQRGRDAIAAAYALNLDQYEGRCNVAICHAADCDQVSDPTPFLDREDF